MVPYFGSHLSSTLFYPAKVDTRVDTPYTFNRVSLAGSLLGSENDVKVVFPTSHAIYYCKSLCRETVSDGGTPKNFSGTFKGNVPLRPEESGKDCFQSSGLFDLALPYR